MFVNKKGWTLRAGFGGCSFFPVSSGDMSSTIDLLFAKKKRPDSDEQATPNPIASEDPSKAQYIVLFTVLLKGKQHRMRR